MTYAEFENSMSANRVGRYFTACHRNKNKAMALYRFNLTLTQNLFSVISCFEVTLRNNIDRCYCIHHGYDWIRSSVAPGSMFDTRRCEQTRKVIQASINQLTRSYPSFGHNHLISKMDFGFWRYLFAAPQFHAAGQKLLHALPSKPRSTPALHINHTYIFNELEIINQFRNRLAHHEPICFDSGTTSINSRPVREIRLRTRKLMGWMGHDAQSLLYGIDRVESLCDRLDSFI